MKRLVIWPCMLFSLLCFSFSASAEQNTPSYDKDSPIHITLEAGLYEPVPGCSGATCPAKLWTPVNEFAFGENTHIWVRVVIENRSHRLAIRDSGRSDWLIRDSNGKEPSLTEIGCSLRCTLECPLCPRVHHTATPPSWGRYLPGQRTEYYIEITREYKLTKAGEYSMQLTWPTFYLAPENVELVDPVNGLHSALTPEESMKCFLGLLTPFHGISSQFSKILAEPKNPPPPAVVKFSLIQQANDRPGSSN